MLNLIRGFILSTVIASSAFAGSATLLGVGKPAAGGGATGVCATGWTGPTSGLTHCWPMDNASVSGTTITDVIGSINGTAGAGVTSGVGPSTVAGTARTFNGTTAPIQLSGQPLPTPPYTIGLWTNRLNNTSNDGGDQRWACLDNGGAAKLIMILNAGGAIGVTTTDTDATSAATPSFGAWHHYTITDSGSASLLYIDGVSAALSGAASGDLCDSSSYWLGGRNATDRLWVGSMATTVIYNRVLSGAEITSLFNAF